MKRSPRRSIALSTLVILLLSTQAAAQGLVDAQRTRDALSTFPDSQAVLFVNIQKIVRDTLPRLVSPKELQKFYSEPQKIGFDVKGVEYAIVGMRLADPPPPNGIPDFVVILRGTFNSDSLLALGRFALDSQGVKSASETHGSKTLDIVDLESLNKKPDVESDAGATSTTSMPFKEIAATALDANTIVVGVPSYVKAAIDAAGSGQGRLDAGLIDLATRDENSLISLTADIPPSLMQYIEKSGMPKNSEAEELIRSLKQISLSTGMTVLDYTIKTSLHTDTPEHASAISGFVKMGLAVAENGIREELKKKRGANAQEARSALAAIRTFTNTVEGNTLQLGFSVPQSTIAALVKKNMPRPAASTRAKAGTRRKRTRKN